MSKMHWSSLQLRRSYSVINLGMFYQPRPMNSYNFKCLNEKGHLETLMIQTNSPQNWLPPHWKCGTRSALYHSPSRLVYHHQTAKWYRYEVAPDVWPHQSWHSPSRCHYLPRLLCPHCWQHHCHGFRHQLSDCSIKNSEIIMIII